MYGVCLPGRESRFSEPFNTDWKSLVKDICEDVQGILREKPFVLWGHRLVASRINMVATVNNQSNNYQPSKLPISHLW